MGEIVRLEIDGAVGVLRLDRPPVNAINSAMHAELLATAAEIKATPQIRAVVVYGGERAFAAGADIKEMAALTEDTIVEFGGTLTRAIEAIAQLPVPVIAAVTGYALGGGCELALAADLRIVAMDARLGLPEITLGVIPGAGGTQRLARLLGAATAKELIFSGRAVDGVEAARIGLATEAVPKDQVLATALARAKALAAGPTRALAAAKRAIDEGLDTTLARGLELESRLFTELFGTDDQSIGMASFVANGPGHAEFTGR